MIGILAVILFVTLVGVVAHLLRARKPKYVYHVDPEPRIAGDVAVMITRRSVPTPVSIDRSPR